MGKGEMGDNWIIWIVSSLIAIFLIIFFLFRRELAPEAPPIEYPVGAPVIGPIDEEDSIIVEQIEISKEIGFAKPMIEIYEAPPLPEDVEPGKFKLLFESLSGNPLGRVDAYMVVVKDPSHSYGWQVLFTTEEAMHIWTAPPVPNYSGNFTVKVPNVLGEIKAQGYYNVETGIVVPVVVQS